MAPCKKNFVLIKRLNMKKICNRCKLELEVSMFSPAKNVNNSDSKYYRSECKICRRKPKKTKVEKSSKVCFKCKVEKDISYFSLRKNKDSITRYSYCKECHNNANRLRSQDIDTKNKKKNYQREYKKKNKEYLKIRDSKYYKNNRENILIKKKQYTKDNLETVRKTRNKYGKKYSKKRRYIDKEYTLRKNISGAIYDMLKLNRSSKNASCLKYLPYTIKELKNHLESLFEPWMNWNNWRKI